MSATARPLRYGTRDDGYSPPETSNTTLVSIPRSGIECEKTQMEETRGPTRVGLGIARNNTFSTFHAAHQNVITGTA
jgi:hypothetical protein